MPNRQHISREKLTQKSMNCDIHFPVRRLCFSHSGIIVISLRFCVFVKGDDKQCLIGRFISHRCHGDIVPLLIQGEGTAFVLEKEQTNDKPVVNFDRSVV